MTLEERIAALEQAMARGAREVEFEANGIRRRVEYHSLKEMADELARLKAQGQPKPRRSLVRYTKGFR